MHDGTQRAWGLQGQRAAGWVTTAGQQKMVGPDFAAQTWPEGTVHPAG